MNSKLYIKAGTANSTSVKSKIIKISNKKEDNNNDNDNNINNHIKKENSNNIKFENSKIIKNTINKQASIKSESKIVKQTKLPLKNTPYFKNKLLKKSQIKDYFKENFINLITMFLDSRSIFCLMLVNKKFYKTIIGNDEIWFQLYFKKFKSGKFETNRTNWRKILLNSVQTLFSNNYNSLKNKFLLKFKKNSYCAKKNPYFISNNLYSFLKPEYKIIIDGREFPVKLVFKNDILTHINFYSNFDSEYINLNKIKKIVLTLSEKNIGFSNKVIYTYEMKKNALAKLENEGVNSKVFKIYSYKEFLLSTFEENFIFFINISIPICKICEIFDFLNGIHGSNLNYFDDNDKNFGLYDYSLLINIKNNSEQFFNMNINTLDFKNHAWDDEFYHFECKNQIVSNSYPHFNIRTVALGEKIKNLLIFDVLLLNHRGDHMICDSFPLIINKTENIEFEYNEYDNYTANINTNNYSIQMFFRYLIKENLYIFNNFSFKIRKEFVKGIYKN